MLCRGGEINPHYADKRPPRQATFEDELQEDIAEASRSALVNGLKQLDVNRMIKTLTKTEVSRLSEAVLSAFVLARVAALAKDRRRELEELDIFL